MASVPRLKLSFSAEALQPVVSIAFLGLKYKNKHRQIITYKNYFMRVKIYITSSSEMCIKTQLKKTLYPYVTNPI